MTLCATLARQALAATAGQLGAELRSELAGLDATTTARLADEAAALTGE
eukprot:SAG22_NODE_2378_length_2634_cov_1.447337_2_plen_49_part_00